MRTSCSRLLRRHCSSDRRSRPPLNHTEAFVERAQIPISMTPIGWVSSPYKERFGTPRQPTVSSQVVGNTKQEGSIILHEDLPAETLRGLHGFDYCWVICWLHLNSGWKATVQPPRGPRNNKQGIFATRAPHRPNPLALSALRMLSVSEEHKTIRVLGLDLLDGTPVLDIKPYVPYCDAFGDAAAGWLDGLPADQPDHLTYWPPPPHLTR